MADSEPRLTPWTEKRSPTRRKADKIITSADSAGDVITHVVDVVMRVMAKLALLFTACVGIYVMAYDQLQDARLRRSPIAAEQPAPIKPK